jgi:hypothetical protein
MHIRKGKGKNKIKVTMRNCPSQSPQMEEEKESQQAHRNNECKACLQLGRYTLNPKT